VRLYVVHLPRAFLNSHTANKTRTSQHHYSASHMALKAFKIGKAFIPGTGAQLKGHPIASTGLSLVPFSAKIRARVSFPHKCVTLIRFPSLRLAHEHVSFELFSIFRSVLLRQHAGI
jgi:hypothetical protein